MIQTHVSSEFYTVFYVRSERFTKNYNQIIVKAESKEDAIQIASKILGDHYCSNLEAFCMVYYTKA